MAEKQFTEAGKAGQRIRSALANAYRGFNSGFTNYVQEPLLNLYPQVIANPTYAATEAVAGALDVPLNLGRFPYYDIETEEERNNKQLNEPEPPEPAPTLKNRDLNSEYYGGPDKVPLRKAKPITEKLYRVMFAGEGPENSIIAETKEEADRILKESGKKGAVAGVNMRQKTRGGKKLTAEQSEKRSEEYINQMLAPQEKENKRLALLEKYRSPEYKKEVIAQRQRANEAKFAKDKEGAKEFDKWRSDVKSRRVSEEDFNLYNQRLDLLKRAYTNARRSGNLKEAYDISMDIEDFQAGVPKEIGARRKEIERRTLATRNAMLAEQEKSARIQAANPDYINPFNKTIGMRYQ